jgi:hypothetical protein
MTKKGLINYLTIEIERLVIDLKRKFKLKRGINETGYIRGKLDAYQQMKKEIEEMSIDREETIE